ncbi:MAG TPA: DoxX family protein [Balneolaceae bacterium]|nr:DoxX family protein [Balneolaceae bacterium]
MNFLFLIARILFSAIFIISGTSHLVNNRQMSMYAESKKIPFPQLAVYTTGIMMLTGGLSILLGLWVKIGALLIVFFLLPAAFLMHNFWAIAEPTERQNEEIQFMRDLALAGGAFAIWYLYMTVKGVPWSIM